jgi:hypothetical protein
VELAAGEELESWAEGRVVCEDADELLHDRLWVLDVFVEAGGAPWRGWQRVVTNGHNREEDLCCDL